MDEKTWLTATNPMQMVNWMVEKNQLPILKKWVVACREKAHPNRSWGCDVDNNHYLSVAALIWAETRPSYGLYHKECPAQYRADILREIAGNPFIKQQGLREGLTKTAHDMATVIRRDHDWEALPILADLLEDGGCTYQPLLKHFRKPKYCVTCHNEGQVFLSDPNDAMVAGHTICWKCDGDRGEHHEECWGLRMLLGR